MVRLLSGATMRPLRLPLSVSPSSLLSPGDTLFCLALLLAPDTRSLPVRQGVLWPVSPTFWLFSEGERRISQVPREPLRPFALLSDPGRTSTPGICGPSVLPPLTRTRGLQRSTQFRDSITRLRDSPHTLRAAISDDDAMVASGWRPAFSGRDSIPAGFLHGISVFISLPFYLGEALRPLSCRDVPLCETPSDAASPRACSSAIPIYKSTLEPVQNSSPRPQRVH